MLSASPQSAKNEVLDRFHKRIPFAAIKLTSPYWWTSTYAPAGSGSGIADTAPCALGIEVTGASGAGCEALLATFGGCGLALATQVPEFSSRAATLARHPASTEPKGTGDSRLNLWYGNRFGSAAARLIPAREWAAAKQNRSAGSQKRNVKRL